MKINKTDFIEYLKKFVDQSIYVWGAQGQVVKNEQFIRDRENTYDGKKTEIESNIKRAVALYQKRKKEGVSKIQAFDCSGLIMSYLQGKVFDKDKNANGLKGACSAFGKSSALEVGDFVFRVNTSGRAYHVGVYIGDMRVIHCKGRDVGVVEEGLMANGVNYWNLYGHPKDIYAEPLYVVKKGDTLTRIAKLHGTTVDNLVKINKIKNPNLIKIGQKIKIESE